MDQQLRVSRWPYLAILACLLATYAILPGVREPNAHQQADTWQQAIDKVRNIDNTSYTVDVFPPVDEINPLPLESGSLPEAVMVKPCAAILSEVSDSDIADEEGIDSISSEPSMSSTSSASETSAAEKEKGSEEKAVETSPAASGPNSLPQSTAEKSPADSQTNALGKRIGTKVIESTTLVAHLPKPTNMPAETMKPGPLDANYPNTGLKPLKLPWAGRVGTI